MRYNCPSVAAGIIRRGTRCGYGRALEHFTERLSGRTVSYIFNKQQLKMLNTQIEIAQEAVKVNAEWMLLHSPVD